MTDEDEFLEAHFDGFLDADELGTCLDTARVLRDRLAAGDELFDVLAWRRLEDWVERALPPLVDFPPL